MWEYETNLNGALLDESAKLPGGKIVKFSECSKKISLSGKVSCDCCNDTINYAYSNEEALHNHVRFSKHVSARQKIVSNPCSLCNC